MLFVYLYLIYWCMVVVVCSHACVCVYMHEHVCVCIGGCLVSSSITVHLIILLLYSFQWSLTKHSVQQFDQPALGILLSPSLHLWDYRFEYLHPAQLFM